MFNQFFGLASQTVYAKKRPLEKGPVIDYNHVTKPVNSFIV
jgi:hypothetical protein